MRRGIYRSIAEGKGAAMPAWGTRLAREQIWALVRHIEAL
ncbi:MAG: cytochrome c [Myxococcales bacterium]|nr:cytochrome c [Myxococcales bacterium]